MKNKLKKFLCIIIALSIVAAISLVSYGAVNFKKEDGLSVTTDGIKGIEVRTTTDKSSYRSGDRIKYTVEVNNTSDKDICDVKLTFTFEGKSGIEKKNETFKLIKAKESQKTVIETNPITGGSTGIPPVILIAAIVAAVLAAAIILLFILKKKGKKRTISAMLIVTLLSGSIAFAGKIYVNADDANGLGDKDYSKVGVHDPSIVKDPATGAYYIFGSHRAWAKTTDLMKWQTVTNNINSDYKKLFNDVWINFCYTEKNDKVDGNCWAPDVIWNDTMKKWCMYMSINGDDHHSAIVLLTADSIDGPYSYVDEVVFSGADGKASGVSDDVTVVQAEKTVKSGSESYKLKTRVSFKEYSDRVSRLEFSDLEEVLGADDAKNGRYSSTDFSRINCIDPCVYYGNDGNLYMVYGSWSAGIFQIRLDKTTGLRDKSVKYETKKNVSDAYLGIKIAGGFYNSGEGPYILATEKYYYLFLSIGNLEASGGYQMRIYRSENPDGPYVDMNGISSILTSWDNKIGLDQSMTPGKYGSTRGLKLMGTYKIYGIDEIQVAQGHNSAFIDDDGRMYVVYHSRYNNKGEAFNTLVHQLFINEDGWPVAAPYEYSGEKLPADGYPKDKITGTYEFIIHAQDKVWVAGNDAGIITPVKITLNSDGSISGDKTGTWKVTTGANVVLSIDGREYKGVFIELANELSTRDKTMTFTVAGNNLTAWGVKNPADN